MTSKLLERIEALLSLALSRATSALAQISSLISSFGTPFSAVLTVPDSGVATTVLTVPVTDHPIIIETTYLYRDPTLARMGYSTTRSEVNLNTPFITTASEFLVNQPGLVNPPVINAPTIVGTDVVFTVTNPIAGNPIDLQVTAIVRTGAV